MTEAASNLLPTSIQRIRVFLTESCGMKVKPWAGVDETLEALHTVIVDKRECGIFWQGLRSLLATLAQDLKQRRDATPGALVDNEVLDASRYETLLAEIRTVVKQGHSEGFRTLTRAVSMPAAALLLLLAGVASVGCAATPLQNTKDAAVVESKDTYPPPNNTPLDTNAAFIIPDSNTRDTPFPCDGGGCTINAVMQACGIDPTQQQRVNDCLDHLKASWRENLGTPLAAIGCDSIDYKLACFLKDNCGTNPTSEEFTEWSICRPILIYLGVRFT